MKNPEVGKADSDRWRTPQKARYASLVEARNDLSVGISHLLRLQRSAVAASKSEWDGFMLPNSRTDWRIQSSHPGMTAPSSNSHIMYAYLTTPVPHSVRAISIIKAIIFKPRARNQSSSTGGCTL